MLSLNGRVAIITGAASGIGKATAELLAQAGATLVLNDINPAVEALAASLPRATPHVGDLRQEAAVQALIQLAISTHGRLDVLVNNAGIDGAQAPLPESTTDNWREVLELDLNAVYWGHKYALPPMQAQGSGSIINMASISGMVGFANLTAYSAAKGAVIQLTRCAAIEAAPQGVRVNAVCPSVVQTPLVDHFIHTSADPTATRAWFQNFNPLPGMVTVEAVAQAVLFLASDAAAFITGVALPIDGGYTAQ